MVPGMVVGIAAKNVEGQPREQFLQCALRFGEAVADDFRKSFIACVARHHFIQLEQRKCRNHRFACPTSFFRQAVEALDQ